MKIGLTYDLRSEYLNKGFSVEETAEMDSKETIATLERTINELGNDVVRIGSIKELIPRLANNERWDLVFNISEGFYGMGREAQIPAVLDAYRIPYTFSDTIVLAVALQKALTKRIAADLGLPTAEFFTVRGNSEIKNVDIPYPLFLKPVAEGTGKGVNDDSIVGDTEQLEKNCRRLLRKYKQPVLVEKYLPGREYTAGILGSGKKAKVIGILEIELKSQSETEVYGFKAKELCEKLVDYKPLSRGKKYHTIEKLALKIHRGINCRDTSRVDFKENEQGQIQFLEINPLAGLHPTHSDLPMICSFFGISYRQLIESIINSSMERMTE